MSKSWRIIFLFLLLPSATYAQGSISGKIVDSTQTPVPFAIVALLHAEDSTVLTGTPADENGKYVFNKIPRGNYLLKISANGWEEQFSDRISFDSIHDFIVPDIFMRKSKIMDAVTITAIRPTIEFRNGNTIVNIENSALAKGNSVWDLLPRLPGISIDKNVISIQGKSGVIVMIDNRVLQVTDEQLFNLLRSMSAESVERIEILKNPPVKYDAAGTSGMINIVTKKNGQKGFSGSVYAGTAQGFYNNTDGGLSLNYKNDKLSVFSSLNGTTGWYKADERHYRIFVTDSGLTQMNNQNHWREKQEGFDFKIGADWFLNPKTTLGFKIDGGPGAYTSYGDGNDYVLDYNNLGFDHLNTLNYIPNKWNSVNYNINAEKLIDTPGTKLDFSADYTDGHENDKSYIENYYYDTNENEVLLPDIYQNRNTSIMQIVSAKLDFTKTIDSASFFEAGIKASSVMIKNDYLFEQKDIASGNFYSDTNFTNKYDYAEQTYAAYINYSRSWKRFNLQLGIRAEETVLNGRNYNSDFELKNNYFNLFPNLSFEFIKSEKHDFQLNLNRRIDRPVFDEMNPFIYYHSPYSYNQGNPFLQPHYSNRVELTHSFMGTIVNSVSFERINKLMLNFTVQNDSTKIFIETIRNMDFQNAYTYSLFIQQDLKPWWSFTVTGNFSLIDYKGDIQGVPFRTYGINYYANLMNNFIFPHKLNLELMLLYRGPNLYGITQINPVWMLSAALKKNFFGDKISFSIGMNNIFNTMRFHTHAQFDNQDWNYFVVSDSRRINLGISYNFGKVKVEEREMNSNEEEKGRLDL